MRTIAHVTHEAVHKVGGIGAVLEGLLTSAPYQAAEQRTILIGPLFVTEDGAKGRLGPDGEVLYSSIDHLPAHPVGEALDRVRREFHVQMVYGHRRFSNPHTGAKVSPEILLIDVARMDLTKVNQFKAGLWHAFGIDSTRYESSWEYDLYVKLGPPAIAALHALGAVGGNNECVILAHEFMGMPTALAAIMDPSRAFRTVFHAHEVSAMRRIVESHPGHDVSFYNVLSTAIERERYVSDVFGSQDGYYRHALVSASRHCDKIFAVGDEVVKELRFIGAPFARAAIDTAYNGIPSQQIGLAEKRVSHERMKAYAQTLLGDRPDYIFSHVTRTAPSKGLWRDLRVLERLEPLFRARGKTAVMFVLSTEVPARRPQDVLSMERWWRWPVAHREVDPDLSHGEALFYQGVQEFNARARAIKVVFVNQFGWSQAVCGSRMPANMDMLDIRRGTDLEFGQSIYEPFGIAQLEPLTYGGICVPSNVCGCVGFVEEATAGGDHPNVIIADYCHFDGQPRDEAGWLSITREERDAHEGCVAERIAAEIMQRLPENEQQVEQLMTSGYELARQMSWDVVAEQYVLPGIESICRRKGLKVHAA
ncbi:MAG: hypothetical protein KA354_05300 [Phycisphaerae bacterium]|nr:hypothetical protein [Phycisphaerae bacterium]